MHSKLKLPPFLVTATLLLQVHSIFASDLCSHGAFLNDGSQSHIWELQSDTTLGYEKDLKGLKNPLLKIQLTGKN